MKKEKNVINKADYPMLCMVIAQIPKLYWNEWKEGFYTLKIPFNTFRGLFRYPVPFVTNDFGMVSEKEIRMWHEVLKEVKEEEVSFDETTYRKFIYKDVEFLCNERYRNLFIFSIPHCEQCLKAPNIRIFKDEARQLKISPHRFKYGEFWYCSDWRYCDHQDHGNSQDYKGVDYFVVRHNSYHG